MWLVQFVNIFRKHIAINENNQLSLSTLPFYHILLLWLHMVTNLTILKLANSTTGDLVMIITISSLVK